MTKITVITGSTCSGKTRAAIDIAEQNNAEIISCDSVQVYRGMDIGSAKATKDELKRIRHHLIDVCEVEDNFDISRYVALAKMALADILGRGKNVVVAGGSGFYLKAWFEPVADELPIDDSIRFTTDKIEAESGATGLAQALLNIDNDADKWVDMLNPRRTKNALARCMASGKSVRQLLDDFAALPCPLGEFEYDIRLLNPPQNILESAIILRTADMIKSGLIEETKKLLNLGIRNNLAARSAIGYRETIAWLDSGSDNIDALREEITKNTISLTKKQRKFLRFLNKYDRAQLT